ncbi:putative transcriptional regulator [Aspergillus uvarum CBS 121591]|uniref:Putative transcriptional regulator n=1 Tax=Aspergillus uvarum CBS 121591 TaxID=1448315 RepID=A0A319BWM4_9EURO|nr:putative transcriptional regulator [Aspergillus uvarum CBS 121591]PYH75760.1 putative transcriptional regulator [Aspergillus uvarum CBS 121591]
MAPKYALSESESESELAAGRPDIPSDDALEQALRDTVAEIYKSGKLEELTVKRVRLATEKALKLDEGFFKTQGDWKARSKEVIRDQVEVEEKAAEQSTPKKNDSDSESELSSEDAKPAKRTKSTRTAAPRKRQKTSPSETDEDDISKIEDENQEDEVKPSTKRQTKTTNKIKAKPSVEPAPDDSTASANGKEDQSEDKVDSESEMSVVLDEEPKPVRKRQKSAETSSRKGKKAAPAKGKDADQDLNQAEIKRLQGWLIKCGIRKMWARELAPFDNPKAKIKHLKDMLKEAGMEGRYSVDKANRIREERELKADLELVQEGAKRWGKEAGSDDSEDSRPRRKLNRGRRGLAFLEGEDGEETD